MIQALRVNGLVEAPQQFAAVARCEINSGQFALLQGLVGIKRVAEQVGMTRENFAAAQLGARSPGAQLTQLVLHFASRPLRRLDQRGIQARERIGDRVQRSLETPVGVLETLCRFLGKSLGRESFPNRLRALEKIRKGKPVTFPQALSLRLDQSRAEAWQNGRHPAQK